MPVAKTYERMEVQGEPFCENKRMYVYVLAPKGPKKVRWYSEAEYRRMYPEVKAEHSADFNAYVAFGFAPTGYITVYKGRNVEDWAENDRTNIWYNLTFGYYTPGRLTLPVLINGIEPIKVTWEQICIDEVRMKPHEEVQKYIATLLGNASTSIFQGEINEWLQKEVTVTEKTSKESHFGTKHTYRLSDAEGNTYVWETGTKDYACDTTVSLKMKVKEHKEIKGEKVTVVWYCKEV